jgi:hypothetical protein
VLHRQVDSDEIAPLTSVNRIANRMFAYAFISDGPLAQVVEQLAFNQRVAGSSPARLTSNSISYGYRRER